MAVAVSGMAASCDDFLSIEPLNDIVLEKFWTNEADVTSVMNACYTQLESADCIQRMIVWGELRSDNMTTGSGISNEMNQMLKEKQGVHNSCGFGIWETVLRYRRGQGIPIGAFAAMSRDDRLSYLRRLRDGYFAGRMRELGLAHADGNHGLFLPGSKSGLEELFFSDGILFHFDEDCETMLSLCPLRENEHLRQYQTVLFENAQGLLLDGNAREEMEFTTPSTTGVGRVFQTVESVFSGADVEVCYVTRSYLTRHGDGSMENELTGDRLAALLPGVSPDATNVENRFQGILRYGMMDVDSLTDRIRADYARTQGSVRNHYHPSVMVTHLNECAGIDTDRLARQFGTLYLSDGRTCRDVCRETAAVSA